MVSRRRLLGRFVRRYGKAFTANILMYGRVVVVADPQLARQVFTSSPEELGNIQPNLSRMFGSGSVFALDGDDHRRRRRLLAPPFHGKSMKNYETIIEEETLRETANWPQGQAFATLPSMMHITLNAILRAIFGAGGSELDELRRLIPPWVTLGSRLAALPKPKRDYGRLSPWGRLAEWRRQYDTVIDKLIEAERADPNFADRTDVLALMLRSTYDDGSIMSRKDIGDELLTLLAAGHETTAATLGWAFERLSRHPDVLAALVEEVDNGGHELRQAAILEVQRARTVIDFAARRVNPPVYQLGEWVIPRGYSIIINIAQIHGDPDVFRSRIASTRSATSEVSHPRLRGSLWWRDPPLCRGRIRQHGDGCGAANGAAPLHPRDHHGRGRAQPRSRSCIHPEGWRSGGDAPTLTASSGPRSGPEFG